MVVAGLGAFIGLVLFGDALLRPDHATGLANRIETWTFWCSAGIALIAGYTTFEVLYRNRAQKRLSIYPIPATSLFYWTVIRTYRVHLPLLMLPMATGITLLKAGLTNAYLIGVGVSAAVLVWGLATAIFVHLVAGRSMLAETSNLKDYLVQGLGPPEAAFLFYSPAGALTAALMIGLFTDVSLQVGFEKGQWNPFIGFATFFTAVSAWCLWKARSVFTASSHLIMPRFADAEVLPPWREDELPRHYLGENWGRFLPKPARALWLRNLLQYRRRFRVIIPLFVIATACLFGYAMSSSDTDFGALRLALIATTIGGLVFTPVFRLAGRDLKTRFDARALPISPGQEMRAQWLMAASEWLPLALVAAGASLAAGHGVAALAVLVTVLGGFVVVNAVAIPMALRSAPDIVTVSVAVRGGLLLIVGGASYVMRIAG
jgi:hypothetical protein